MFTKLVYVRGLDFAAKASHVREAHVIGHNNQEIGTFARHIRS